MVTLQNFGRNVLNCIIQKGLNKRPSFKHLYYSEKKHSLCIAAPVNQTVSNGDLTFSHGFQVPLILHYVISFVRLQQRPCS